MTFSFANVLREHASNQSDHPAFVHGARRLSFGQFHERSSRAANALAAAGVGQGDRVGILMKNTLEYYELVFACSKLGATAVCLNWRLAPAELAAILADAEPSVIVADADGAALVAGADVPVVAIGDDYEARLADASADDPETAVSPDDVLLLLYSSGTTGLPKGIMLTNENLSYTRTMATELFRMTPETVHLVISPLFHIGGIGTGSTTVLLGGKTVIALDATPAHLLDMIETERVTHAFCVPAIIQSITDLLRQRPGDLSSLKLVFYGGAPMTEALLRRAIDALGCGFIGCYGMTETAGTVSALWPEEHTPTGDGARLLRSVGRPLPWLELKVADVGSGEELPPGEVGEIWVRSGSNMRGYWRQPAATENTLVEGWVRTGDGAYRDDDGYLFLKDRIKDMIISGGENIYPAEVENALAEHSAVADVAVIGVPHERWGETPKAMVVAAPGHDLTAEELIEFTRSRLARYKCPTSVEFLDELPRNPSGKVLKHVLRKPYWDAAHQDVAPASATSSLPVQ